MLRPVLLIGVGGSGGKTLRAMRQSLLRQLRQAGWQKDTLPAGWQMLWVDSVRTQNEDAFPAPLLPNSEYVGLVSSGLEYADLRSTLEQAVQPQERQAALAGWVAPTVPIAVAEGAGQARAIGRVISAAQLARLKGRLEEANDRLGGVSVMSELKEVSSLFGQSDESPVSDPMAIVISSVAGGSGSGMFLDVVEALKTVNAEFRRTDGIITVLYTPDVFTSIGGAGGQIPPNALAAVMEVTAGVLAGGLSAASSAVLSSRGLIQRSEHGFGAKCNFLVGASNKNVVLGTQEDVYYAVGDSLSSVVTDDKVQQTLRAFTLTNVFLMSGEAMLVEDRSQLSEANDNNQSMPFSALGMGRASLGTDRLFDFISQLVSRDIAEQLMWPDFEPRRRTDGVQKTREEVIDERVARSWGNFLSNSRLNERDPADDIIDALVDPLQQQQRMQQWVNEGHAKASQGVDGGGLSPAEWAQRLQNYYDNHVGTLRSQETGNRYEKAQEWTESLPAHLTEVIAKSAMLDGLEVTGLLVNKLMDEMVHVASELLNLVATKRTQTQMMSGKIQQILNVGANKIGSDDPAIAKAVSTLRIGAELEVDADRLTLAAGLVEDLRVNLLGPLHSALQFSRAHLSESVNAAKLPDGRLNPWEILPRYDQPVPTQLLPGSTERVLIEPNTYAEVLAGEVQVCLKNPQDKSAWRMVLRERAALGQVIDSGVVAGQSIVLNSIGWVPVDAQAANAKVAGVKADFKFPDSVQYIQKIVEKWLANVELGGDLARFLKQGLVEYVESGSPAQQVERSNRLIAAFTDAVSVSAPFVQINQAVKSVLHPNVSDSVTALVSTIPFVEGHPLHDRMKNVLVAGGLWSDSQSAKWFATAKVDNISVFTMSGKAMMPIVFDNIMKPIAQSWATNSGNPATRHSFWSNRRARPLVEFIPMGSEQLAAMVRGWFLSSLFNQRPIKDNGPAGWQVQIWEPLGRGLVDFPYPLLSSYPVSKNDLPAAVFKSITIAMVKVNELGSLAPLRPYHRLMELGNLESFKSRLELWIKDGKVAEGGAPVPDPKFAGSPNDDLETRREMVVATLERTRAMYQSEFEASEDIGDPFTSSGAWEMRDYLMGALIGLIAAAGNIRDDAGTL